MSDAAPDDASWDRGGVYPSTRQMAAERLRRLLRAQKLILEHPHLLFAAAALAEDAGLFTDLAPGIEASGGGQGCW